MTTGPSSQPTEPQPTVSSPVSTSRDSGTSKNSNTKADSAPPSTMWHDAFAAISLANLIFLRVWRELLFASDADTYWLPDYTSATYFGVIANVAWVALLLFGAARLLRQVDSFGLKTIGRLAFLSLFFWPLEFLRTTLHIAQGTLDIARGNPIVFGAIGLLVAVLGLYLLTWKLPWTARTLRWLLIALSPLAVVTLPQAALRGISAMQQGAQAEATDGPQQAKAVNTNRPRVIWLLFDELDPRYAFWDRPDDIELPNFDRLREQSVFAIEGASYGQDTLLAIPSYFTGELVSDVKVKSNEMLCRFRDTPEDEFHSLADTPHIFKDLSARDAKSALVGIYHPYPRLLGDQLERCSSYMVNTYTPIASDSLLTEMKSQLQGLLPFFRRLSAVRAYHGILDECMTVGSDPSYDFLFAHISVPHGPAIYDRKKQDFTYFNVAKDGYIDNLVLADIFLGEVRSALEEKGVWDDSVILVNSDHELRHVRFGDRKRIGKIPMLMKMPGQQTQLVFDEPFSPKVLTKNLILDVMDGKVTTAEEVVAWLSRENKYEPPKPKKKPKAKTAH